MKLLAVDVGTTTAKCAIFDDDNLGSVVEEGLTLSCPRPGWVEQDPDQWWAAVLRGLRRMNLDGVEAISVTGQMQDLICVDHEKVLRPAVLYSDQRAVDEHRKLSESMGAEWTARTMATPDATNVAAKWMWLQRHEQDIAAHTRHVLLGAAAYITWRLTGRATSDTTTAATTGLLDVANRSWWSTLVETIGLPVPDLVNGPVGSISAEAASTLAIATGVPVFHASGDAVSTSVGVLGDHTDEPYAYLGTSGWVGTLRRVAEPRPGVIVLPAGEVWLSVAPILAAGSVVEWAREILNLDTAAFDRSAADVCAATEGVVFVPHLDGMRLPVPDPHASGTFVGLRRSTTRATMAAAVYEGIAHTLSELASIVLGGATGDLRVCGGGSRSDVWCQTIADVVGHTVVRVADEHASLRGAALEALRNTNGHHLSPAPTLARFEPRTDRSEAHRRAREVHRDLNRQLNLVWRRLETP